MSGADLKRIMRTGTVASTDNRNWELLPDNQPQRRFSQSRAVALDMESATIAANGFRFRVPYGTLLCVSDKPCTARSLPGMANHFYRERVDSAPAHRHPRAGNAARRRHASPAQPQAAQLCGSRLPVNAAPFRNGCAPPLPPAPTAPGGAPLSSPTQNAIFQ